MSENNQTKESLEKLESLFIKSNEIKKHRYLIISEINQKQIIEILEDIPSVSLYVTDLLINNWFGEKDDLDYLIALKKVQMRNLYLLSGTFKLNFNNIILSCSHIIK